ncbi:unnamed protein product [Peronospora destructor]|uniref:Uncharacterized protein n=1 Tax=Peronospora destructor TaxID=86335 RepID=A0AAV0UGV1_9STRA|nr:unnamed protein product [Peronospora destructor]
MAMAGKGKKRKAASSGTGSNMRKAQRKGQSDCKGPLSGLKSNKKKGLEKPQQSSRRLEQTKEEDVEIDEEDVAFYNDNTEFTAFLDNMDAQALSKPVRTNNDKKPTPKSVKTKDKTETKDDEDEDMPLEKLEARPRKAAWTTRQ